jgi:predicted metal-dependent hydrolase
VVNLSPPAASEDLPPYQIRESARSRHVRLKVSAERGLEAIIPKGYNRALIPDILASKRDWIAQALERIQSQVDCRSATRHLPDSLHLPSIDRHWPICYHAMATKPTVKLRSLPPDQLPAPSLLPPAPHLPTSLQTETRRSHPNSHALNSHALNPNTLGPNAPSPNTLDPNALDSNTLGPNTLGPNAPSPNTLDPNALVEVLVVQGDRHDPATRDALCRWLKRYAKTVLVPWLAQVAQDCQLSYDRVQIRDQKTRWASCSSYQTIGLNYHLLFLPPTLVRYVLIHELCHTRELNHSPQFWSLVEQYEPNYRQCNESLKRAWRSLPGWSFDTKV